MATNKILLAKGVKTLFGTLPLLFLGPIVLNSAFKNENHPWYYVVLIFGILVCFLAIFLGFKGLKNITNALFDGNQ